MEHRADTSSVTVPQNATRNRHIYIFMEKFFSVNKHDKYSILSTHELQILKILQTVSNVIHASGYGQVYILD